MNYKRDSTFSVHKGSGKVEERIAALEQELSRTHIKLNHEFTNLERSGSGSQINVIVGNTSSQGGGSIALVTHNARTVSLTSGDNLVPFTTPFSGSYVVGVLRCYATVEGKVMQVGWHITATTDSNFTINADSDCTLEYFATESH
jgi:hypothetical protein